MNEVMVFSNGGINTPKDEVTSAFILHVRKANVVFGARNAIARPDILKILEEEGSGELPQLWINGKLAGKGKELATYEKVFELTESARRAWPRPKQSPSYYKGFPGYQGVTTSTDCVNRPTAK